MSLLENIQSLDDLELMNKKVLLRTDLDSPLLRGGKLGSDVRIRAAAPTISELQKRGALVIVASRFGEFRGTQHAEPPSIEPAAALLSEVLETEVFLPDGCVGDSVKKVLTGLRNNQVCVLENLALEADRGAGAEAFARHLASYVDIFVSDSVRTLSGESATTTILPRLVDFRAVGPTGMRELAAISRIRSGIDRPRLVIWGGNGLSSRLDVLDALSAHADQVYFVGVAANTMLRALGKNLGRSAVEEEYLAGARSLAERLGRRLILPVDVVAAESPRSENATNRVIDALGNTEMALDLGPRSSAQLAELCQRAETVVWCGTAGFFKAPQFAGGTKTICEALAKSSAFTMVTGDDSVAAAHTVGQEWIDQIDCLTLGGDAALSLLKDNKLPGLEALRGTTHE
jgi:phosphoglycerate kinase